MRLGKIKYVAWVRGGTPCEFAPTLKAVRKLAKACEGRGGSKHDFYKIQRVRD